MRTNGLLLHDFTQLLFLSYIPRIPNAIVMNFPRVPNTLGSTTAPAPAPA